MTTTAELIEKLTAGASPVRRLRHPLVRAASWLLLAAFVVLILAIEHGLRSDIETRVDQPVFVVGLAASILTGILATVAAFMTSLPDRSPAWLLLPMPALLAWLSAIGYGCLSDWVALTPSGPALGETARCFATLSLASLPLSVTLVLMLRSAAPLRPTMTTMIAALAVAAIAATALSLLHDLDATILILLWNFGVAGAFVALGGAFGRSLLTRLALPPPALSRGSLP